MEEDSGATSPFFWVVLVWYSECRRLENHFAWWNKTPLWLNGISGTHSWMVKMYFIAFKRRLHNHNLIKIGRSKQFYILLIIKNIIKKEASNAYEEESWRKEACQDPERRASHQSCKVWLCYELSTIP